MILSFFIIAWIFICRSIEDDLSERETCYKIRHDKLNKREIATLVGAGSSTTGDDDIEFDLLYYNFENQNSFLQVNIQDSSPFENNGRFSPGGLVLQIPGSSCNNAAYLSASDIVINGETFQAKPTYGITVSAYIMLLDIKGRHNIFETYGYSNPKNQFHFEVDYGILRWYHSTYAQGTIFEVAAQLVPVKTWTHVVGTYNSTTGISQVYIDGKPTNRTYGTGKMSKDWSCIAHVGGQCLNKALMGFIDEFRIYNYALTSKEVETLYTTCNFINVKSLQAQSFPMTGNTPTNAAPPPEDIKEEYFVKKTEIPSLSSDEENNSPHSRRKRKIYKSLDYTNS